MASPSSIPASSSPASKKWTREEDDRLIYCVSIFGAENWDELAHKSGLQRNGRNGNSCRFRWKNYLQPGINTGSFTEEEDDKILRFRTQGSGWSEIAEKLPGRKDNHIKNRYNTHLAKKVEKRFHELIAYCIPNDKEFQSLLDEILPGRQHDDDNNHNMPTTDFELGIFNSSST